MTKVERSISTNSLVYRVRIAYNQLQYLLSRTQLLRNQDSVFNDLIKVNDIRYRVGQISSLEKLNGESQYQRIHYTLKASRSEFRNAKYHFNLLLGRPNDTTYIPSEEFRRSSYAFEITAVDTMYIANNPLLDYSVQQEGYNRNLLKVERRKRIPGRFDRRYFPGT